MDINNLNENEVRTLIEAEKNLTNELEYQEIVNQIQQTLILSSHTYRTSVEDEKRKIIYQFQVHSTPIATRFSVGLMFIDNRIHLIRLDFGDDLRHTNNYGTDNEIVVLGSHAHVYSPAGKYISKNVIPISSIEEFKNIKR
ncbi:DUF6978 family protein [Limosilactobacillus urinaemulieris]|uniref:DUF6978 family protein n=1 Tax=Limosilactobacillus urinaemulieris TaxID=2742600 RepID=UPI001F47DBE5|nr:hypothetical protein [Limosilactobacillus urinaemulieris]